MEHFLPFNHIDDESTFFKVVSEISQCQTVFENVLHESKLFNPFDINEEENDITEYHGDLDPDKCYYNQFCHNLIKIATTKSSAHFCPGMKPIHSSFRN